MSVKAAEKKSDKQSQEQIVSGFNDLRKEQRSLAQNLADLEGELKEHIIVINTLKDVDTERKCYRMIGGVLVERQVKDVLPDLRHNEEKLGKLLEVTRKQFEDKGNELQGYKETHNIRFVGERDAADIGKEKEKEEKSSGVLVS